jgi:hypothetical protein
MSTNSQVQQLAPPGYYHPSLGITPGRDLLPPTTELLLFDIFAYNIAVDNAASAFIANAEQSKELQVLTGMYQRRVSSEQVMFVGEDKKRLDQSEKQDKSPHETKI